ncbi:TIM23 complex component [Varicellaria rhodocarpa]|nr:TIM23 complex component [Varicellaria rhodocarpa]
MTKMLFSTTTAAATRCSAALTTKLSLSLLAKTTTRPSTIIPLVSQRHHYHPSKPSSPHFLFHSSKSTVLSSPKSARHSSTTSTTTTTTSSPSPPSSPTPNKTPSIEQQPPLTWSTFLHLRKKKRHYNLASSILTSFSTTIAGMYILSQQDIERLGTQVLGLDPIIFVGVVTIACGAVGWLIGPFAGGAVFAMRWRGWRGEMAAKEKEFYQRIKRYRADPSSQSVNNPVPDYYGEKVDSIMGYRRWLKDQRAFMRKRETSF